MAYHIEKVLSNGYRCSCCCRSWDSSEWADTLEEALEQVPPELVDGEPHPYNGDAEIESVKVINGSTGERVAWGTAHWGTGYGGKYGGYDYTCWSGYRPDTGGFEVVYDSGRKKLDQTWAEVRAQNAENKRQSDLAKAERELADAQARIKRLSEVGSSEPPAE